MSEHAAVSGGAAGAADTPDEDGLVKAGEYADGTAYHFGEFVEWPQEDPRYDDHVQGHGTPPEEWDVTAPAAGEDAAR